MDEGIPEPLVPAWAHEITSRSLDGLEPLDRWVADAALLRAYQGSQLLFERIPGSRLKKNGEWKRQAAALIYSLSLRRVCVDHDARTLLAGDSYERIRAVIARALPGAEALLDDPELAPSLRLFESINRSAGLKKAPTGVNAMILLESVLVGLNSVGDDLARAMLGEPPASKDPRERQAAGGSVREDPRPSMDDSRVLYLTGDALGFVGEAQRGVDLCLAFGLQYWESVRSDLVDEPCDQELGTPAVVAGFLAAAPLAEERWQIELTDGPGHAPWQVATIAKEVGFEYQALLSYLQAREPQRWLSGLASATSELLGANGVHLGDTERMELPMRLAAAAAFLDNVAG